MTPSMTRSFPRVLLGRFAVALAVSVPLVLGGVVGVNAFIDRKIDEIPRVKVKTAENTDPGQPANFLLIGSDTRAEVQTPEERAAFGDASSEGGQRSDTLMVIHVDPEQKTGFLVSFPRDLAVNVPGLGQQKINAAFNSDSAAGRNVSSTRSNRTSTSPSTTISRSTSRASRASSTRMGGVPVTCPRRPETRTACSSSSRSPSSRLLLARRPQRAQLRPVREASSSSSTGAGRRTPAAISGASIDNSSS